MALFEKHKLKTIRYDIPNDSTIFSIPHIQMAKAKENKLIIYFSDRHVELVFDSHERALEILERFIKLMEQ